MNQSCSINRRTSDIVMCFSVFRAHCSLPTGSSQKHKLQTKLGPACSAGKELCLELQAQRRKFPELQFEIQLSHGPSKPAAAAPAAAIHDHLKRPLTDCLPWPIILKWPTLDQAGCKGSCVLLLLVVFPCAQRGQLAGNHTEQPAGDCCSSVHVLSLLAGCLKRHQV